MTATTMSDRTHRHDLACLGVTREEEAVYRALLREPGIGTRKPADLAETHTDELLGRLRALGMVTVDQNGGVAAVDPSIVVDRLTQLRLDTIQSQLQQVLSARNLVNRLLQDQQSAQPEATDVGVERVEGLDRARSVIEELSFYTHHEMLSIQPGLVLSPEAIAATRAPDLRCLRRGVSMRTIIRKETLHDEPTAAYLKELALAGMEIRLADGPLDRALIFDRCTGVVPLDPESSAHGVMVIRAAGLIGGMVNMFERVWSEAKPHSFKEPEQPPTENEIQVLHALARGDKDEVGARAMGISVRSYRSHVASVIQRLGAESRFQAALRARERGWL